MGKMQDFQSLQIQILKYDTCWYILPRRVAQGFNCPSIEFPVPVWRVAAVEILHHVELLNIDYVSSKLNGVGDNGVFFF